MMALCCAEMINFHAILKCFELTIYEMEAIRQQ
jgi:hypothetical protein